MTASDPKVSESSIFDTPFERRPWFSKWLYWAFRSMLLTTMVVVCGIRARGRDRIPMQGKALLMANHASYYDVIVLGISQPRNIDFMARSGLFIPGLGWLIRNLGGFAIQRGGGAASGIKETLRRLRYESMVGMFPEGTRTSDGNLLPIKSGVANIARRSSATIACAGISGAFEAWPRHRPCPGSYPIYVEYALPIQPQDFQDLTEEEALKLLESRLADAFSVARAENDRLRDVMMF